MAESTAQAIKNLLARVAEGVLSATAIVFWLLIAVVFAYMIIGSCTGKFEQRSDFFRELPGASQNVSSSPV